MTASAARQAPAGQAPVTGGATGKVAALEIEGLNVRYGAVHAVRDASLIVRPGQVVALIGETGSGKSSLALAAARLLPGSAAVSGEVVIAGQRVFELSPGEFRRVRAGLVGCVAQDAMAALNPVVPVGRQIGELFAVHSGSSRRQAAAEAVAALASVEIAGPAAVARLYPHQLSGGMRQRVMIAMAIALAPPLIIADEPTTALDVSTQAEILRLIGALRSAMGSGFLWITHDMGVVAELADWAAVMYAGRIVEQGPVEVIFDAPVHPYTEGLLATRRDLRAGPVGVPLFQIPGSPPGPEDELAGCPFRPRCPRASQVCAEVDPVLLPLSVGGPVALAKAVTLAKAAAPGPGAHQVACHHPATPRPAAPGPATPGPATPGDDSRGPVGTSGTALP